LQQILLKFDATSQLGQQQCLHIDSRFNMLALYALPSLLVSAIISPVIPLVILPLVPMIVPPLAPIVISPVIPIISPPISVPAFRFRHLPKFAITTFGHNELAADFIRIMGKHPARHRGNEENRVHQAITSAVAVLVRLTADHVSEHAADRRPEKGCLAISAGSLADQCTVPGSYKQSVDPVFLGLGVHGQCSQQKYRHQCRLDYLHGMFLPDKV
jgi:hypothetical protein